MPPQTLEQLAKSQLAQCEVPPLPEDFGKELNQRLNYSLVAVHVVDLLVRGLPYAFMQFGRALIGLVIYSATGKYLPEHTSGKKRRWS